MKKQGVYITSYDLQNQSDGVSKKIIYQIDCFKRNGFDVIEYDSNSMKYTLKTALGILVEKIFGYSYTSSNLLNVLSKEKTGKIDFVYIRKDFCNKKQIDALCRIRYNNPDVKILVEYPTYPYDEEIRGRRKIFALPIDKKNRDKMKNYIDRAVTFSDDKILFGTKCLNISNAIDYSKVKIREIIQHDGINLVAVALFGSFHGYDRLIKSMGENRKIVEEHKIRLHLVGDGYAIKEYKDLVKYYHLENYVVFYGRLYGDKLDEVYNISDIAVDTLGRHRVGCFYNSSLKGKEYGAKGLPIISGVKTDLDRYNEDFYYRVPADESLIDMRCIVDFYQKIYTNRDAVDVAERIRETTSSYFNFDVAFKPVIDYLKE